MKRNTTKDILAESFLELINDKRISKITINDITSNCGMTPPTFYNYFKDKYDLIVWIYVCGVEPIISQIGDDEYKWRDILHRAASYYWDNKNFVVNALRHTSGHDSFLFLMQKINAEYIGKAVRKKLMTERLPDEITGLIRVYVCGTIGIMTDWLVGDNTLTLEHIVNIWDKSLPEPLRQYVDHS